MTVRMLLVRCAMLLAVLFGLTCARGFAEGVTRITFFDVGKADCALIETAEGTRILIDTATDSEGKTIAKTLKKQGIDTIDLMIVSHFDKDHVGGADEFLSRMEVKCVLMPIYEKDSKQLRQFEEALLLSPQTRVIRLGIGEFTEISLDDVTLTATAAHEADYGEDEENDFSLCVRIACGTVRLLFPGDAESTRQEEILLEGDVACDVLKAPYHGRTVSTTDAFLAEASAKIIFVPDSLDEQADVDFLDAALRTGATVYRAATDGTVVVCTDGGTVWTE